jgi:hypothetical protein
VLGAIALGAAAACAQDLEPRAYSPSPKGTNFALVAYSYVTGDVVFDPSLPFSNVQAHLNGLALGYGHTFGLFGHSASAAIAVPYAWGTISGDVGERSRSIYRSGLADLKLRFTSSLIGGPALTPMEFAQRHPRPTLGMSLVLTAPTGQYDPAKLINISANRWAVKPELGFSHPTGRWTLEAYAGVWLYTDNDDYYGGQRRSQSPLGTFQAHVGYTFKPRLWLAGDATFYGGGSTTVNGVAKDDRQENSRLGLTLSLPLGRHYSFKASWASGVTTRIGGDFDTYGVALQRVWF